MAMDASRKYIFGVSETFMQRTPIKFKVPELKIDKFNPLLLKEKFYKTTLTIMTIYFQYLNQPQPNEFTW